MQEHTAYISASSNELSVLDLNVLELGKVHECFSENLVALPRTDPF